MPEWDSVERDILDLYKSKCALCSKKAVTIHEIVPKSRRPTTWMAKDNRVPVCAECHNRIHNEGTRKYEKRLKKIHDAKIASAKT